MANKELKLCMLSTDPNSETLRSVAGFHNLESYHVDAESADNNLVTRHEHFHDRFLRETPYGLVQSLLKACQVRVREKHLRLSLTQALNELMIASRDVHERAATYCSIKAFPKDQHARLLNGMPETYQRYYRDFEDLVEPVIQSSYLQFSVAKTIVELSLGAPLGSRISNLTSLDDFYLEQSENPEQRWKALVANFPATQLERLIEHLYSIMNDFPDNPSHSSRFDIQSEEDWSSLSISVANRLDDYLEDSIRNWLYETTPPAIRCLEPAHWHKTSVSLASWLKDVTGIEIEVISSAAFGNTYYSGAEISRARRAANTTLFNKNAVDLVGVPAIPDKEIGRLLTRIGKSMAITNLPNCDDIAKLEWIVYLAVQSGHEVARLTHEQFERLLNLRNKIGLGGLPFPNFQSITVGADRESLFPEVYTRLAKLHFVQVEEGTLTFEPDKLVWYISGDLYDWVKMLTDLGQVQFMPIFSENWSGYRNSGVDPMRDNSYSEGFDRGSFNPSELWKLMTLGEANRSDNGGSLFGYVFRVRRVPGIFFRWMSSETSTLLQPLMSEFDFEAVPLEEREALGALATSTSRAVGSTWSTF